VGAFCLIEMVLLQTRVLAFGLNPTKKWGWTPKVEKKQVHYYHASQTCPLRLMVRNCIHNSLWLSTRDQKLAIDGHNNLLTHFLTTSRYGQVATIGLQWTSFLLGLGRGTSKAHWRIIVRSRGSAWEIPRQTQRQRGTLNWGGEQEHRIWGERGTPTFKRPPPLWCTVCTKWAKRGQTSEKSTYNYLNMYHKGVAPLTRSKGMRDRWHPWRFRVRWSTEAPKVLWCPCNELSCTCLHPKI
jgi:hypothetical protein